MAETNLVFVKLECNFVKVSMKPYFGAELANKKLKVKEIAIYILTLS